MSYIDDLIEGQLRMLQRELENITNSIKWSEEQLQESKEKKSDIECKVAELALEQRKRKEENEKE